MNKFQARIKLLANRKGQFDMLLLPGQPMMTHIGTSYLVDDLWNMIKELEKELEARSATVGSVRPE